MEPLIDRPRVERAGALDARRARRRRAPSPTRDDAVLLQPDRGVNLGAPFDADAMRAMLRVDAGAHRRRARRHALPHQHAAALSRRPRRRQGRGAVRGRPQAGGEARPASSSPRARPTSAIFLERPDAGRALSDEGKQTLAKSASKRRSCRCATATGSRRRRSTRTSRRSTARSCAALQRAASASARRVFVRRSRVKVMDEIARLVDAEACVFTCGERPGLGFADSMSAYYIYRPASGATDADREVISQHQPARPRAGEGRARRGRGVRAHPARQEIGSRPVSATQPHDGLPARCAASPGSTEPPVDPTGSPTYQHLPLLRRAVRRRRSRQDRTPSCARSGSQGGAQWWSQNEPRARGLGRRGAARRPPASPMAAPTAAARPTDATTGLGLVDLAPLVPRALAVRTIPRVDEQLAAEWKLPDGLRAVGIITCTSRRRALRRARRGHQGGAGRGRLRALVLRRLGASRRGRCRARRSASTRRAIPTRSRRRSTPACARSRTRPGSTPPTQRRQLAFFPHVVRATGSYLSREAGIAAGAPMAYLIAPPLESMIGARRRAQGGAGALAKWFGPPSETNFGGGYLVGRSAGVRGGGARVRRRGRRRGARADRRGARGARGG